MSKILIDEAVVRQALEYLNLQKMYGPAMGFGNTTVDDPITALRQALADAALDKMADNARELGLSYQQLAPVQDDRNKLADWMMKHGFATGHGDTMDELLCELDTEIEDRLAAEREACARFVEEGYVRQFESPWREDLAAAIRARGNT